MLDHTQSTASRNGLETALPVIEAILASFIGHLNFGKFYGVKLSHAYEELQDLAKRVTIELELMNVAKDLKR